MRIPLPLLLSASLGLGAALPAQLSGPYVVGPGGAFLTLTSAITALNTSGVSGPVSFLVTANDSGPWTLGTFPGQGPNHPVLFDGQGTVTLSGGQPVLTLNGCDSVTFRGFNGTFGNTNYAFVVNPGTANCVFTGCNFQGVVSTSGLALFNLLGGTGNRIEDSSFGGSYEALYVAPANDLTTIQRCVITGGGWWIMRLGGSNLTLVNNYIIGNSNYGISAGISGSANGPNLRIRHNSVFISHTPTAAAGQYCSLRWYSTAAGSEVLNNIFYDSYSGPAHFNLWGTARPVVMDYNCLWSNVAGYTPVFAGSNLSFAGWQGLGFDTHGINADPSYVLTTINPPILLLQSNSPCATAGTVIPGVTTDYYQALRTPPVSMGAHEQVNGVGAYYATFGGGCAGTAGVPSNTAWPPPSLGALTTLTFGNLPPPNALALALGASNKTSSAGALPIHLAFLGAPGCSLRVSLDVSFTLSGSGGTASLFLPIPNVPSLMGVEVYTQALVLDPGRNGLGAVMSDAATLKLGL